MKKLSTVLLAAAILLSDVMCAVVAYLYRDIVCGMDHLGYSVPPRMAFLFAIPFLIVIAICIVIGIVLRKKAKS